MEKLKILNLSHSHNLTQTPDFSNLPNLEKLVLIDCPRLFEVSHTVGHLNKILMINLKDCISLHSLPRSIYKLKSLKTLILSGCLKIDKLEEDLEQMESLMTLIADNTAITKVPFSIVTSKSIGYISMCGYEGFSCDVFPSIILSWMSPMSSLSSHIQTFAGMPSPISLHVANNSSHNLLSIFEDLPKLRSLWVECGTKRQLSQETTIILDALYAINSKALESVATTSQLPNVNASTLIECGNQVHISGSKDSLTSLLIQMGMSCQIAHILKHKILQVSLSFSLSNVQFDGFSLSLSLTHMEDKYFYGYDIGHPTILCTINIHHFSASVPIASYYLSYLYFSPFSSFHRCHECQIIIFFIFNISTICEMYISCQYKILKNMKMRS